MAKFQSKRSKYRKTRKLETIGLNQPEGFRLYIGHHGFRGIKFLFSYHMSLSRKYQVSSRFDKKCPQFQLLQEMNYVSLFTTGKSVIIPIPALQLFLSWSVFITKFVLESSSRSDEEERSRKTSSSRNLMRDHGKRRLARFHIHFWSSCFISVKLKHLQIFNVIPELIRASRGKRMQRHCLLGLQVGLIIIK